MIEIKGITDAEEAAKLVEQIVAASWVPASEITPEEYTTESVQKCLENPYHVLCVATYDGVFAGMASAFLMPKPDGDQWLYVDEVDVVADQQQKGVGTALMQFLLTYAKEHDCDEVWLGTEHHNEAANALYTSLAPSAVENFVGYTFKL